MAQKQAPRPGSHKLDHLISTAVRCQACFEGTFEPAFGPQNTGLRAEDSGRRLSVGSSPLAGLITQPTGLNPQSQEIIPNEEASSRTARSAGTNRRHSRRFYLLTRRPLLRFGQARYRHTASALPQETDSATHAVAGLLTLLTLSIWSGLCVMAA